jgi:hypothetical protein
VQSIYFGSKHASTYTVYNWRLFAGYTWLWLHIVGSKPKSDLSLRCLIIEQLACLRTRKSQYPNWAAENYKTRSTAFSFFKHLYNWKRCEHDLGASWRWLSLQTNCKELLHCAYGKGLSPVNLVGYRIKSPTLYSHENRYQFNSQYDATD